MDFLPQNAVTNNVSTNRSLIIGLDHTLPYLDVIQDLDLGVFSIPKSFRVNVELNSGFNVVPVATTVFGQNNCYQTATVTGSQQDPNMGLQSYVWQGRLNADQLAATPHLDFNTSLTTGQNLTNDAQFVVQYAAQNSSTSRSIQSRPTSQQFPGTYMMGYNVSTSGGSTTVATTDLYAGGGENISEYMLPYNNWTSIGLLSDVMYDNPPIWTYSPDLTAMRDGSGNILYFDRTVANYNRNDGVNSGGILSTTQAYLQEPNRYEWKPTNPGEQAPRTLIEPGFVDPYLGDTMMGPTPFMYSIIINIQYDDTMF